MTAVPDGKIQAYLEKSLSFVCTEKGIGMLQVQLFDHFCMSDETHMLDEKGIRSEMVLKLLTYMICHRDKVLSVQELTEALWEEDRSNNPAGALKNLMYRLRTTLKNVWPETDFIQTGRGSYQWNPQVELRADTEEFEKLCRSEDGETEKEKLERQKKAARVYRGQFLSGITDQYWITALSAYYHSMYLNLVKELAEYLEKNRCYQELEELMQRAVKLDMLDEDLYCWLIRALIGENRQNLAAEYYHRAVEILYENLGVRPSKQLQDIYGELMRQQHEYETDIRVIQADLKEEEEKKGAFYCEYGVFRKAYELEVRRAGRMGISVWLSLITLHPSDNVEKNSSDYRKIINTGMEQMEQVLLESLRQGDVITRYSASQFILLLPSCQYENARKVLERIQYRFYSVDKKGRLKIQYSLDEMELN